MHSSGNRSIRDPDCIIKAKKQKMASKSLTNIEKQMNSDEEDITVETQNYDSISVEQDSQKVKEKNHDYIGNSGLPRASI